MSLLKRIEQGKQSGDEDPSLGSSGSRLGSLEARRVSPPRKDAQDETYADLKVRVQNRLLAELDPSIDVSEVEKVLIGAALQKTNGRKNDAAMLLGWGRNTLTRKIKELDL